MWILKDLYNNSINSELPRRVLQHVYNNYFLMVEYPCVKEFYRFSNMYFFSNNSVDVLTFRSDSVWFPQKVYTCSSILKQVNKESIGVPLILSRPLRFQFVSWRVLQIPNSPKIHLHDFTPVYVHGSAEVYNVHYLKIQDTRTLWGEANFADCQ